MGSSEEFQATLRADRRKQQQRQTSVLSDGEERQDKGASPKETTAEEEKVLRRKFPTMFEERDAHERAKTVRDPSDQQAKPRWQIEDEKEEARLRRMFPASYDGMATKHAAKQQAERESQERDRELMRQQFPSQYAREVLGDPDPGAYSRFTVEDEE